MPTELHSHIRLESPGDHDAIATVHRVAFGREDEAALVATLCREKHARVSLVAEAHSQVIGHILFSELTIESGGQATSALALAPLAVLPELHRRSVGAQLVRHGLEACRAAGHTIVIVLGEPRYYRRFGFRSELTSRLSSPYASEAFMALELTSGALRNVSGNVVYPPPFGSL